MVIVAPNTTHRGGHMTRCARDRFAQCEPRRLATPLAGDFAHAVQACAGSRASASCAIRSKTRNKVHREGRMRARWATLLIAVATALVPAAAGAQDWPTRPLHVIV